jgi:hypothetical protein
LAHTKDTDRKIPKKETKERERYKRHRQRNNQTCARTVTMRPQTKGQNGRIMKDDTKDQKYDN